MTRAELAAEYRQTGNQQGLTNLTANHQAAIKQAAAEGKPISAAVLQDYPALAKTIKPSAPIPETGIAETKPALSKPAQPRILHVTRGPFGTIVEKSETISKEKEGILKVIAEIDVKKKKIFIQTLKQLNELFSRNFSELSTKGHVFLEMENPKERWAKHNKEINSSHYTTL